MKLSAHIRQPLNFNLVKNRGWSNHPSLNFLVLRKIYLNRKSEIGPWRPGTHCTIYGSTCSPSSSLGEYKIMVESMGRYIVIDQKTLNRFPGPFACIYCTKGIHLEGIFHLNDIPFFFINSAINISCSSRWEGPLLPMFVKKNPCSKFG